MGIVKDHWTPRYAWDRVAFAAWSRRNKGVPWINRYAISAFDDLCRRTDRMIEFGSGASTQWFAERVGCLVSVEPDREWFEQVRDQTSGAENVDLRFARNDNHAEYFSAVDDVNGVDIAFVDVTPRGAALDWSLERVVSGGLIVLDDAHRYLPSSADFGLAKPATATPSDEFAKFHEATREWRKLWTHDGVQATAFFFMP